MPESVQVIGGLEVKIETGEGFVAVLLDVPAGKRNARVEIEDISPNLRYPLKGTVDSHDAPLHAAVRASKEARTICPYRFETHRFDKSDTRPLGEIHKDHKARRLVMFGGVVGSDAAPFTANGQVPTPAAPVAPVAPTPAAPVAARPAAPQPAADGAPSCPKCGKTTINAGPVQRDPTTGRWAHKVCPPNQDAGAGAPDDAPAPPPADAAQPGSLTASINAALEMVEAANNLLARASLTPEMEAVKLIAALMLDAAEQVRDEAHCDLQRAQRLVRAAAASRPLPSPSARAHREHTAWTSDLASRATSLIAIAGELALRAA